MLQKIISIFKAVCRKISGILRRTPSICTDEIPSEDQKIDINDVREHLWVNPYHTWEDHNKKRKQSDIKLIVLHDTGNEFNDVKIVNEMHIKSSKPHTLGLPRIKYHYFVNEYGDVYLCNDLESVTWHSHLADKKSVAVALVGDYDSKVPDRKNLKILERLFNKLLSELKLSRASVRGHGELKFYMNFTDCPGKNLMPYLKKYRETGKMV